jgi:hypothetical protein
MHSLRAQTRECPDPQCGSGHSSEVSGHATVTGRVTTVIDGSATRVTR